MNGGLSSERSRPRRVSCWFKEQIARKVVAIVPIPKVRPKRYNCYGQLGSHSLHL